MKPCQENINISEGERHKFPRKSSFDASTDIYDESTESVFDALLRIFDDGNDTFKTVEIPSIKGRNETVVGVRGTKRKISELSNKKDGKYQCKQCEYETRISGTLRTHVESKHEGVRYPCDQCDYKATQEINLKKHKEYKHCLLYTSPSPRD